MDEATNEQFALAVALLLEAGRLMEDSSPEFALVLPDSAAIIARAELLARVAGHLQAFAAAALVLIRAD
ncbi:MAG: hypothetical protein KDE32_00575 [Novosphingobium sp.]|nr:hypothetical protein [Novosphingobium sp.]